MVTTYIFHVIFLLPLCLSSIVPQTTPLYEDFSSGSLDPNVWLIAQRQWGGCFDSDEVCHSPVNGGVVPDNVFIEEGPTGKMMLRLEMHGNNYVGPTNGVYPSGGYRQDVGGQQRVGAIIATKQYFGSGSYEVRAKLTRYPAGIPSQGGGVANMFSTRNYRQYAQSSPLFQEMPVGYYYRVYLNESVYYAAQHEIDIIIPGRTSGSSTTGITWTKAAFNYYRGQNGDSTGGHPYSLWDGSFFVPDTEWVPCHCLSDIPWQGWDEYKSEMTLSASSINNAIDMRTGGAVGPDGQSGWHVWRFDWHTGGGTQARRVEYYLDGALLYTSESDPVYQGPSSTTISADVYVPLSVGRFWAGGWFPYETNKITGINNHWAGEPTFEVDNILIDYISITPFNEPADDHTNETDPNSGWAHLTSYPSPATSGTFTMVNLEFLETLSQFNPDLYVSAVAATLNINSSLITILSVSASSSTTITVGLKIATDWAGGNYGTYLAQKLVYVVNNGLVSVFASQGIDVLGASAQTSNTQDWNLGSQSSSVTPASSVNSLDVIVPAIVGSVGGCAVLIALYLLLRWVRAGPEELRPYNSKLPL